MGRVEIWDDEPYPNACELFQRSLQNAIKGRGGQALLREMEEALLSLPQKKLAADAVVKDGCGCSLAEVEIRRRMKDGASRAKALLLLEVASSNLGNHRPDYFENGDLMFEFLKGILGIKQSCLAWQIVQMNDEASSKERYDKMLGWVREHLAQPEGAAKP